MKDLMLEGWSIFFTNKISIPCQGSKKTWTATPHLPLANGSSSVPPPSPLYAFSLYDDHRRPRKQQGQALSQQPLIGTQYLTSLSLKYTWEYYLKQHHLFAQQVDWSRPPDQSMHYDYPQRIDWPLCSRMNTLRAIPIAQKITQGQNLEMKVKHYHFSKS